MKKLIFLVLLALTSPVYANGVPTWTTGTSNRTENTTQTMISFGLFNIMGTRAARSIFDAALRAALSIIHHH